VPLPIEQYAFLSDTYSAALVGSDGSIDWLAFPRFDSPACFAALLGTPEHGRWLLAPAGGVRRVERRYRTGTLVLETVFHTDEGEVAVVDCMPPRDGQLDVVRVVEGRRGRVQMRMDLLPRFDLGLTYPWVRRVDGSWAAVAGPDAVRRVRRRRGRHRPVPPVVAPVARGPQAGGRRARRRRAHRAVVAGVERPQHLRRGVGDRGP
jgi:GH15 family glucan-1,4-alpha-glucosidase